MTQATAELQGVALRISSAGSVEAKVKVIILAELTLASGASDIEIIMQALRYAYVSWKC